MNFPTSDIAVVCPLCHRPAEAAPCEHLALAVHHRDFMLKCLEACQRQAQWPKICKETEEAFAWADTAFVQKLLEPSPAFVRADFIWKDVPAPEFRAPWVYLWTQNPSFLWLDLGACLDAIQPEESEECDPGLKCPVCGAEASLNASEEAAEFTIPCHCKDGCMHLVVPQEFGTEADDLASFCRGSKLWGEIRMKLPETLKEEWRQALERGDESRDLEGHYFIDQFVKPCPSVVEVEEFFQTVGGPGCASNVCTPFIWVKARATFAQEVLEQLKQAAAAASQAADCRKKASARKPRLDLDAINDRHVRGVDKFYRMFAGAASTLTSFKKGIIHLDIHVDNRLNEPLEQITRKIAESWLLEKELKQAKGYLAHLYKTERPSGCAVVSDGSGAQALTEELIRRMQEMAVEYPDVLITTIAGSYAKP